MGPPFDGHQISRVRRVRHPLRPARLPGSAAGAIVLLSIFAACGIARAQSQDDEYRVKAAFLFHFAQLVEWPPDAGKDGGKAGENSLVLCTIGDDPFQGKLEALVEGKTVGSKTLHVRHLNQAKDIHLCQILFVSKAESKHLQPLIDAAATGPIMTVGETDHFIDQGGVLDFRLQDDKVRFDINLDAAGRARLKISSRLLLLAKRVVGKEGR